MSYSGEPEEKAAISPLFVVFLRLGLFDEFVELWQRAKLDLPPEIEALVRYCQDAYPLYHWRGKEYRARHRDEEVYVMGAIVWGDEFIENFMQYNLRSMLAPGNLPALGERGSVVFSIITNPAGELRIRRHPVFAQLSRLADIEFSHIPEALLSYLRADYLSSHFYIFYGIVDHCSIFFAQGANAHLFMIPVDAIVAQGSLDAMARYGREGFGCCGGGNIVAESETFLPALARALRPRAGHRHLECRARHPRSKPRAPLLPLAGGRRSRTGTSAAIRATCSGRSRAGWRFTPSSSIRSSSPPQHSSATRASTTPTSTTA